MRTTSPLKSLFMKCAVAIAVVLFASAGTVKADSIVSVQLLPVTFPILISLPGGGGIPTTETIGVTFDWNTTTQTLSNFVVTSSGPLTGYLNTPPFVLFDGSGSIELIDFFDSQGGIFQLDYFIHSFPPLPGTPGTYVTDLDLICSPQENCANDHFALGTATVTATPEPATFALLTVGFAGMLLRKRKKSASAT